MPFSMFFSPTSFGALTAKPYAFSARPWELVSRPMLDPLDSLATPLRLDLRGPVPLRVLPRSDPNNPLGDWISDRTRFAYDGFRRQRLSTPLLRVGGPAYPLRPGSWQEAFRSLATFLSGPIPPALVAGPHLGFSGLWAYRQLAAAVGLRSRPSVSQVSLSPESFSGVDHLLLVGCDLRLRLPLVYLRLRRLSLSGVPLFCWGTPPSAFGISLGHRPSTLFRLVTGRHRVSPLLASSRSPRILLGENALHFSSLFESRYPGCVHPLFSNSAGPLLNFLGELSGSAAPPAGPAKPPLWLFAADNYDWSPTVPAVIYQGHHGDRSAARATLVLPTPSPLEEDGWRLDLWGRAHFSSPSISNSTLPSTFQLFGAVNLLLSANSSAPPFSWLSGRVLVRFEQNLVSVPATPHYTISANPYRLDSISRSSRPLALAARRLTPSAPNYPSS